MNEIPASSGPKQTAKAAGRGPMERQAPADKTARSGLTAFRLSWAAFLVLATSAPYLVNWILTPPGFHYTWILPPYPQDSLAYQAWSEQAARGALLFKLKYTALSHTSFLFHPFFLICGWISAVTGCQIGIVHLGIKAIGVALFLAAFYRYSDYLGLKPFPSVVASILLGVSSGMGGILALLGLASGLRVYPADLWLVETSTYWSLLWNPLFPYSLTLLLLAIYWMDRGSRGGRETDYWRGGLTTGLLALIHPYSQPLLYAWSGIITLARRGRVATGLLARYFLALLPCVLYMGLVAAFHPLASRHSSHGEMASPPPVAFAYAFGPLLLLCAAGIAVGRFEWLKRYWQIVLWFVLSLALAYFPFWFQSKLIFGAHIPLCILASIALDVLMTRCSTPRMRALGICAVAILLCMLAATPLYLLVAERAEARKNADGAYYVSDDLLEGFKFLKDKTKPDEVVFASPATSSLIPACSGNTVVWGHWAMSVDSKERETWWSNLSTLDDQERSRAFWAGGVRYIFADGALKASLEENAAFWQPILKMSDKAFSNESVTIYQRRATDP